MAELSASAPHGDDAPNDPHELQFDQAEYATTVSTGPICGVCQRAIEDEYYELGGKVFCSSCRQRVETALRGGSRLARVIKALVFGLAAAAVGAVIYYVILRATGYNIGLVAVVVGFMVGGAVRRGTGNRGGLFYQILAVFLAYTAIGAMHLLPFLFNEAEAKQQALTTPVLLAVDVFILYASPVLHALKAPISGLIFGFALWEAWKINKRVELSFNGPFRVNTLDSNEPAFEVDDGG